MEIAIDRWEVKLLGEPQAYKGEQRAHLRSRECWSVLASMLLPEALGKVAAGGGIYQSRQDLAHRFWADSYDPKHCFRQVVSSIRTTFGDECVHTDRTSIGVRSSTITSDIGRIRMLYEASQSVNDQERQMELLDEAESLISGPFLAGCVEHSDSGFEWYAAASAEVTSLLLKVLGDLSFLHEAADDHRSAFDCALKVLQLNPMNRAARARVWDLGRKTDQTDLLTAYDGAGVDKDLPAHIARRARIGLPLSSKELKQFNAAFETRRDRLGKRVRHILSILALLPGPFTHVLATRVCGASSSVLNELLAHGFVEKGEERFTFTNPVRACATKRMSLATRQRTFDRLFTICEEYLVRWAFDGHAPSDGPFPSPDEALPFLEAAVSWLISQPPYRLNIGYLNLLRSVGLTDVALRAVPWLQDLLRSDARTSYETFWTCTMLGLVLSEARRYGEATDYFVIALRVAPELGDISLVAVTHDRLAFTYHHANVPDLALFHNERSIELFSSPGLNAGLAHTYRFRAEIQTALGDYSGMLDNLERAHREFKEMGNAPLGVAECLYWKGQALIHLGRNTEAFHVFEEALRLRLDNGDSTGAGHCLADMGYLRGLQEHFGEARAHIQHAMLLHLNNQDEPGRIAALGNLGDVYLMEGRALQARDAYAEGLKYWEAIGHERWCERFVRRLERTATHLSGDTEAER